MNEVGLALDKQGRYSEAEKMHMQTLATKEKVLGVEHPDTLTPMKNLALVLSRQGKYSIHARDAKITPFTSAFVVHTQHCISLVNDYSHKHVHVSLHRQYLVTIRFVNSVNMLPIYVY
jgi:hypothetical protein